MSTSTRTNSIFYLSILGITASISWHFLDWNFDDSNIVYRIVDNITSGKGWSFNPEERLNASTSALNTITIAALAYFSNLSIPVSAHTVGGLGLALTACCLYSINKSHLPHLLSFIAAVSMIALSAQNSTWGLETHLFYGLICFYLYLRQSLVENTVIRWATLGLLVLGRPDAVVFLAIEGLAHLYTKRRVPWLGILSLLVVVLPWVCFSLIYFKQIFPDTLAAKIWQGQSGLWGHGLIYLKGLLKEIAQPFLACCLFLSLLAFIFRPLYLKLYWPLIVYTISQQLAYCFLNVPPYHWYLTPVSFTGQILAILFVLSIPVQFRLINFSNKALEVYVIFLSFMFCLSYLVPNNRPIDLRDKSYSLFAKSLQEKINDTSLRIATLETGTLAYELRNPILDLTGLTSKNSEFVSGENTDKFFEILPQIIVIHKAEWHFERAITDDLRFKIWYEEIHVDGIDPFKLVAFKLLPADRRISEEQFLASNFEELELSKVKNLSPSADALCVVDSINGRRSFAEDIRLREYLNIKGWAALKNSTDPDVKLKLLLESKSGRNYVGDLSQHSRPDVMSAVNLNADVTPGYNAEFRVYNLEDRYYRVWIGFYKDNRELAWCRTGVTILF